jgi:Membrane-associated phospholipid phosphatase
MGNKRSFFRRGLAFALFGVFFVGLMAVGAVWDLDISHAFANPERGWARVMEVIAEPPTILLCSFMCAVICRRAMNEKKMFLVLLMTIAQNGTVISVVVRTCTYLGYDYSSVAAVTAVVIISSLMTLLGHIAEKRVSADVVRTMLSCVIAALATLILINVFKSLWGRVRYRDMVAIGSFNEFTPWYIINGITGNKSFPSGHTANVVLLFYLTYFAKYRKSGYRENRENHENGVFAVFAVYAAVTLWVLVTMISRVAIGAHYLSDVTAGAAITAAIVYVTGRLRGEFE